MTGCSLFTRPIISPCCVWTERSTAAMGKVPASRGWKSSRARSDAALCSTGPNTDENRPLTKLELPATELIHVRTAVSPQVTETELSKSHGAWSPLLPRRRQSLFEPFCSLLSFSRIRAMEFVVLPAFLARSATLPCRARHTCRRLTGGLQGDGTARSHPPRRQRTHRSQRQLSFPGAAVPTKTRCPSEAASDPAPSAVNGCPGSLHPPPARPPPLRMRRETLGPSQHRLTCPVRAQSGGRLPRRALGIVVALPANGAPPPAGGVAPTMHLAWPARGAEPARARGEEWEPARPRVSARLRGRGLPAGSARQGAGLGKGAGPALRWPFNVRRGEGAAVGEGSERAGVLPAEGTGRRRDKCLC